MTIPFIPFIPADAAVIPGPPEATVILAAIEAEYPEPHARDTIRPREVKKSRFLPRWAREANGELALLGDMPNVGCEPDSPEPPEPPSVVVTDVSGPESDAPTPGWWRIDVYRHGARWQTLYALPARPGAAGGTEAVARAVAGYLASGPCTTETGG